MSGRPSRPGMIPQGVRPRCEQSLQRCHSAPCAGDFGMRFPVTSLLAVSLVALRWPFPLLAAQARPMPRTPGDVPVSRRLS